MNNKHNTFQTGEERERSGARVALLWKTPKTNPTRNQAVTWREGEFRFITYGPRGTSALKIWDLSLGTIFLLYPRHYS